MFFLVIMMYVVWDWGMIGYLFYVFFCECFGCSLSIVCVVKWVLLRGDKFLLWKFNVGVMYLVVGEFL